MGVTMKGCGHDALKACCRCSDTDVLSDGAIEAFDRCSDMEIWKYGALDALKAW